MILWSTTRWIFIASVLSFLILNTIENLIHYNIGRSWNTNEVSLRLPTAKDWLRIILTMIVFALLQGIMTLVFFRLQKRPRRK